MGHGSKEVLKKVLNPNLGCQYLKGVLEILYLILVGFIVGSV